MGLLDLDSSGEVFHRLVVVAHILEDAASLVVHSLVVLPLFFCIDFYHFIQLLECFRELVYFLVHQGDVESALDEVLVSLEGFPVVRHRLLCSGQYLGLHQTLRGGELLVCPLVKVGLLFLLLVFLEVCVFVVTFEQHLL